MLNSDFIDVLSEPIIALYQDFMDVVIKDIARRLAGLDYATPTAAWQMQRLTESGKVYDFALEELSKLTGKSVRELRSIFKEAGVRAIKFDDAVYIAAGLKPLPLNLSPAMVQVLSVGLNKTQLTMQNLTQSIPISVEEAFIEAADLAYMEISSGAFDYNSAIRSAVKEAADHGIKMIGYSTRQDQLDVAMRRAVLTGVSQTVGNLQIARADEMGCDLVAVSAHLGARDTGSGPENHESWQGKVYSRSGTNPKYKPFVETTGYGTGPGLLGWGCRHSFFPFFEGISENQFNQAELDDLANKSLKYNGQVMSYYEATQKQREIERNIRYWKRQVEALEAAKQSSIDETAKLKSYQEQMRGFINQINAQLIDERKRNNDEDTQWLWQRQRERERI